MSKFSNAEVMPKMGKDGLTHPYPWRFWQCRKEGSNQEWKDATVRSLVFQGLEFRRKPKTININGFEVPEPVRESLEMGQDYYSYDLKYQHYEHKWTGSDSDLRLLKHGLIQSTREGAKILGEALISFTKQEEV